MPNDETAIREMSNQIGKLDGTITQFIKSQTETNIQVMGFIQKHEEKDSIAHKEIADDVSSLKLSRKMQRVVVVSTALGTPAAAAKLGFLGKILAAFASTP